MTPAWAWPLTTLAVLGWILATLLAAACIYVWLLHRRHGIDPVDVAFATIPRATKPPAGRHPEHIPAQPEPGPRLVMTSQCYDDGHIIVTDHIRGVSHRLDGDVDWDTLEQDLRKP